MAAFPVPSWVQAVADDLADATGHQPQIDQLSRGKWRVTVANERVRLTLDYRRDGRGRIDRAHTCSTLHVDGTRWPLAASFDHFVRIFHDPDTQAPVRTGATPMPPPRPLDEAPVEVRLCHQQMRRRLRALHGDGSPSVAVGFDERRGRWVVGADIDWNPTQGPLSFRGSFREFFVRDGRRWTHSLRRHQAVINGIDRTGDADRRLPALIASMVPEPPEAAPDAGGPLGGSSGPASEPSRSRKGTVMRT